MKKFKFLFDLDETLVTGDTILEASKYLYKDGKIDRLYTSKDIINWELDGVPECVKELTFEYYKTKTYGVDKKVVMPGVLIFLFVLKQMGHECHILTSRPESIQKATNYYVKDNFSGLIDSVTCTYGVGKVKELCRMEPDYFFDDNPAYCEQSRMVGIKTFLISNENTTHNKNIVVHNDIMRIQHISHMPYNLINRIQN